VETLVFDAVATQVVLTLAALGGVSFTSEPVIRRLGLTAGPAPFGTTLLLVVGFLGISQSVESILELARLRATGTLAQLDAALTGVHGPDLALAVLGLGVAPGLGEELFARGWIQRGLTPYLGSAIAVVIAAAVFGALHADPVHSAAAFVLGLYLGAAVELTQSLRTSILCHITNNLVWLASAGWGSSLREAIAASPATQIVLGVCGALAGVLGLGVAFRRRRLRRGVATHREAVTEPEEHEQQG
jgi:membrane protease YdiL (CAAX protease family)